MAPRLFHIDNVTGDLPGIVDTEIDARIAGHSAVTGKVPTTRTVNGHALTGDVDVTASDLGLGDVDNTADDDKPVSTAQAAADAVVLATATGRAIAFSIALGG